MRPLVRTLVVSLVLCAPVPVGRAGLPGLHVEVLFVEKLDFSAGPFVVINWNHILFAPLYLFLGDSPLLAERDAPLVQHVKVRSELDLDVFDNSYSMDTTATPW